MCSWLTISVSIFYDPLRHKYSAVTSAARNKGQRKRKKKNWFVSAVKDVKTEQKFKYLRKETKVFRNWNLVARQYFSFQFFVIRFNKNFASPKPVVLQNEVTEYVQKFCYISFTFRDFNPLIRTDTNTKLSFRIKYLREEEWCEAALEICGLAS